MDAAKIRLSPKEMGLVTNAEIILTKNAILEKANRLLGEVLASYREHFRADSIALPPGASFASPKISRGENYRGLPWLILDYPRSFQAFSVLAIRTMFWWGNFFSITLHLAGEAKELHEHKILSAYGSWKENGFSIAVNNEEWEHHFGEDNYRLVSGMKEQEFAAVIRQQSFVKIANRLDLHEWNNARDRLLEYFVLLVSAVIS